MTKSPAVNPIAPQQPLQRQCGYCEAIIADPSSTQKFCCDGCRNKSWNRDKIIQRHIDNCNRELREKRLREF